MPASVVLLHGLRTSSTMWRRQVAELEAAGIPAVAIDLPGHGHRMSERFSLDAARVTIADAVAEAATSGHRPYLAGLSLGGYLAIDWVAQNPDRVCGVLAASCGTTPHRAILDGWRVLARGIHALPDRGRALNDFMLRLMVRSVPVDDVLAGGVALEVMDDVLRELRHVHPMRSLPEVDVPVLFVNGRLDHFRLQAASYLAATPRGRLVTVAGASHLVSIVRPREFTEALLDGYAEATVGAQESERRQS
ncbi:alpha/beta fold hydrolase [Salinibacterium sp. ZJ450]|uniref:alpha/beta fold hydrolase n=1 Tax=Salinibacterium sp. ZJ450 TaxID=2708338 RepID=UPI0014200FEE|nr:alpha/beta fold hydrolase [Salinibacterium sp. ZJ450]